MKLSSVIGSVALFLMCLILIVAGIFWYWPEATARVTGFGPYDATGIALYCALLVIVVGIISWAVERMFERAGKAGLRVCWHKNQQVDKADNMPESYADEDEVQFNPESLTDHLNLRYGRFWKSKVRILLVQGESAGIEKAAQG